VPEGVLKLLAHQNNSNIRIRLTWFADFISELLVLWCVDPMAIGYLQMPHVLWGVVTTKDFLEKLQEQTKGLNSKEAIWCAHCIRTNSDPSSVQTSTGMKKNYIFPVRPVCGCRRKWSV
jgi:hypothetical protein